MSGETAQAILVTVVIAAGVAWLIGLWFLNASYDARNAQQDQIDSDKSRAANWFAGSVEVEGQPSALVDKAALLLVKKTSGALEIVEKTRDRLAFQRVGPNMTGLPERGEFRFSSTGGKRTRIEYEVEVKSYRWLLWVGGIFQAVGLVVLTVGGWAIYEFCVSSQDPAVRGQTLQMLQVVHFLWPPFLFGALYRHRRRAMAGQFETFLRSLPFQDEK